jgi:hypothetical protein
VTPWPERTAVTLDVDWAPDFMIEDVTEILVRHRVAATWFATHASPALDALRAESDLFELGIHPNFGPGSTHGDTAEEVLAHCLALVPEARAMRTHGLVQSSALLSLVRGRTPITIDVSLFLPYATWTEPLSYPLETGSLQRIPFIWEDDAEMNRTPPQWSPLALATSAGGLAVFDFHPVHVFLNAESLEPYAALKARGLDQIGAEEAARLRRSGPGARTAFVELVEGLAATGGRRISDLTMESVEGGRRPCR